MLDEPYAPAAPGATLWVSSRGEIVIDASIEYLQKYCCVLLRTKYTVINMEGKPYIKWRRGYIAVPRPRNRKERNELLRNMATMHAMKMGYPHRLRSKV